MISVSAGRERSGNGSPGSGPLEGRQFGGDEGQRPRRTCKTVAGGSIIWHMKFEEGLQRLEQIVGTLDEGEVSVDEALALFKEGLSLTKELSKRLDDIERKVEILVKKENGSVGKKPFLQEEG
jgi:exodeoxyribonuclease VII small subunit